MKNIYFIIATIGFILPYFEIIPFIIEQNGFPVDLFFEQITASRMARLILIDLLMVGITFMVYIISDKNKPKFWWVSIVLIFMAGICSGFPFYLGLKELEGENTKTDLFKIN